jgi:hypothetical protein
MRLYIRKDILKSSSITVHSARIQFIPSRLPNCQLSAGGADSADRIRQIGPTSDATKLSGVKLLSALGAKAVGKLRLGVLEQTSVQGAPAADTVADRSDRTDVRCYGATAGRTGSRTRGRGRG